MAHNFLLPCITVEENIISNIIIFNLYFLCFAVEWITCFYIYCLQFFSFIPYFARVHHHLSYFYNKQFILYPRQNCRKWNKYSKQLKFKQGCYSNRRTKFPAILKKIFLFNTRNIWHTKDTIKVILLENTLNFHF